MCWISLALRAASAAAEVPADEVRSSCRSGGRFRRLRGSHQMLYSAAGVTLPTQQGLPPMMMQRSMLFCEGGIAEEGGGDVGEGPR